MRKIGLVILALLIISILLFTACAAPSSISPSPSAPSTAQAPAGPKSIVIGALVSLTGPDAQTGIPSRDGYQMAVDTINANGGILVKEFGKKIPLELVALDMQSDPEKTVARAEALNSQNASVAVGTTTVFAASDIFEKNKMPAVTMLMNIGGIYQRGFKYYFGIGKINSDTSKAYFDLFQSLPKDVRPTKLAFIQEQAEWTNEFFGLATKEAAARGMTVVSQGKYAMLTSDMSPLIRQAKTAGAEVVLSLPVPPDGITMLKQMKELDYRPKGLVMMRASDDPSWPTLGDLSNYTIGSPDWHSGINFPGVKDLNDKMKAKTGKDAEFAVGPAYASIQVIAAAIEKAGTLDRTKIRDAIAVTDMMTVVGTVKFKPDGSRLDPIPTITQLQNGKMELVWPDNLKTRQFVYPR